MYPVGKRNSVTSHTFALWCCQRVSTSNSLQMFLMFGCSFKMLLPPSGACCLVPKALYGPAPTSLLYSVCCCGGSSQFIYNSAQQHACLTSVVGWWRKQSQYCQTQTFQDHEIGLQIISLKINNNWVPSYLLSGVWAFGVHLNHILKLCSATIRNRILLFRLLVCFCLLCWKWRFSHYHLSPGAGALVKYQISQEWR